VVLVVAPNDDPDVEASEALDESCVEVGRVATNASSLDAERLALVATGVVGPAFLVAIGAPAGTWRNSGVRTFTHGVRLPGAYVEAAGLTQREVIGWPDRSRPVPIEVMDDQLAVDAPEDPDTDNRIERRDRFAHGTPAESGTWSLAATARDGSRCAHVA
jgi:hypothetical protein